MRILLETEEALSLEFRPDKSGDEILLAWLMRVFIEGGQILVSVNGTPLALGKSFYVPVHEIRGDEKEVQSLIDCTKPES